MSFTFFNTLTKKKEVFKPKSKNVSIYSCGPTVYAAPHIGNFRAFLFADLLRRALKFGGYEIEHTVNITDIDDKTIAGVRAQKPNPSLKDLREYTAPYIEEFQKQLTELRIETVEHNPRATENIDSMVDLASLLLDSGHAYENEGSIYFRVDSYKEYGQLSGVDMNGIRTGTRYNTDEYSKDDIRDFALWKHVGELPEEAPAIAWETPIGRGRPGWHLECSAMIHNIYGGPIDIHTGGVDLIFPHHENEIAQSVCGYHEEFVRTWLHCEHLLVNGKKMSKSLGNVYRLDDIKKQGFTPRALRFLLMSTHYRQKVNFTWEALEGAAATLRKIDSVYERILRVRVDENAQTTKSASMLSGTLKKILEALQDDLNISRALAAYFEGISFVHASLDETKETATHADLSQYKNFLKQTNQIFAVAPESTRDTIPPEVEKMAEEREKARKAKDFEAADAWRDKIKQAGFVVIDTPDGPQIKKEEK